MIERVTLKIHDILDSPLWVSTDDGQKVYDKLTTAFKAHQIVNLSFSGRETMITAFVNAAIGQLYNGEYSDAFLSAHLNFIDISSDDLQMLSRAITNAKRYFANRPSYDQAWEDLVDEE